MKQDLIDWLNAIHSDDDKSDRMGLLLAPIDTASPEDTNQPAEDIHEELNDMREALSVMSEVNAQDFTEASPTREAHHDLASTSPAQGHYDFTGASSTREALHDFASTSPAQGHYDFTGASSTREALHDFASTSPAQGHYDFTGASSTREAHHDLASTSPAQGHYDFTGASSTREAHHDLAGTSPAQGHYDFTGASSTRETPHELASTQPHSLTPEPEHSAYLLNTLWHNPQAGFKLSLDEPPPEMWTQINQDSDDEPDPPYDEGVMFGQDTSPSRHGTNFTQRLQKILQGRRDRAEAQREKEASSKNHHPYIRKSMIMCGTMLIVLGFAWLVLVYLEAKTPAALNSRAMKLYEQGRYDEALSAYQDAYNRYPNEQAFLNGLAMSAEKAGRVQTAKTAHDELDRISKTSSEDITPPEAPKVPEPVKAPYTAPLSFTELLREGNNAFNVGLYNRALINFHRALELDSKDFRPYVGLAESYRAKGMYFDSKRILDEARRKFRRNPTIEMGLKFLEGE